MGSLAGIVNRLQAGIERVLRKARETGHGLMASRDGNRGQEMLQVRDQAQLDRLVLPAQSWHAWALGPVTQVRGAHGWPSATASVRRLGSHGGR